jgi:hypothetical protein
MYFKFLAHGKGDPKKAASYVVDEVDHLNRPRAGVEVLRGDLQVFAAIADSIQNEWLYTSGIIAWSKADNPTDSEINEVLDDLEKHAFAGLEPHQYHFSAVLHIEDEGSKHVHFLVPRIELESGKALNIAPPGHEKYFDPLRDYFNYSKGWSRPDDPSLKRDTQVLDHIHLQDVAAFKASLVGAKVNDVRENISTYLEQRIEFGIIKNRQEVLDALAEIGQITRVSNNFISLKLDTSGKAVRLKGALYESDFTIESYFENRKRKENDAAIASRANRVISAEHRKQAEINLNLVREFSEGRSSYNTERYFKLKKITDTSALSRVQELESVASNYITIAAQPSTATANRTIDSIDPRRSYEAERAPQEHADSGDFIINNFSFSAIGELNERLKHIDEPTSRVVAEANNAADASLATVRELQQAVSRTKSAFDARKPNEIQFDLDAERRNISDRVKNGLKQLVREIRTGVNSAFTATVEYAFDRFKYSNADKQSYSASNSALREATFGTAYETFFTEYNINQRNEFNRAKRAGAEARKLSQQLDETAQRIDLITRKLSRAVIKPKPSTELTEYFRKIGYLSPAAQNIHSWSTKQHEAFKTGNLEQVAYYIQAKYQEVGSLVRQKSLEPAEIELLQKNIRNDERIIEYMKKSGGYLPRESQQRLDRMLSAEKSANENRLDHLVLKENKDNPLFQAKPETENPEKKRDQDYDLPSPP